MYVLAIDPGHTCGMAVLNMGGSEQPIVVNSCESVQPGQVYSTLDMLTWDAVVVEEFRLYPWLAATQGFSTLHTVEVIGVIKYLCAKYEYPLFMQRADIKKEARHLGDTHGFPMKERTLGSGKGKYRGPDFDYKGPQHGRDALAHGVYWAYRDRNSPLYEG